MWKRRMRKREGKREGERKRKTGSEVINKGFKAKKGGCKWDGWEGRLNVGEV